MDNIFLRNLAESYQIDRDITTKDLDKYLINTRDYLRSNHLEIYEDINYNMTKLNQQKLLYSVLDDVFVEDFGLTAIAATGVASLILYLLHKLFDNVDHHLAKLFAGLQKLHNNIRTNLKESGLNKSSKEYAERYQIVEKLLDDNYSNCSKMCGISDLNKLNKENINAYLKILFEPGKEEKYISPKHASDVMCLVSCYLDFITSSIAELNLLYIQCMQKTGERVKDPGSMRATVPIGSKCNELRKDVNDLKKEFDDFLKYIYKNDPRSYATWIEILDSKIDQAASGKKITSYGPMQVQSDLQTRQHLGL